MKQSYQDTVIILYKRRSYYYIIKLVLSAS
jgi:hypothetical protein